MAKGCALSTGYLPRGGFPRNSVDRIADCPDMTSVVERGHKARTQTNKLTFQCNVHPLTRHFYIVKLGFTGDSISSPEPKAHM